MVHGEDVVNCLLAICPDPEACKPGEFDFRRHVVDQTDKSEKQSEKEKDLALPSIDLQRVECRRRFF